MACVIDTNVLISYFLIHDSVPGRAVQTVMRHDKLIFTDATFGELIAVLYRPKFDRYTTQELRKKFLNTLAGLAEIVYVTRPIKACRDPNDDKFLDAAVHGNAAYIITGDDDLLALNPFMDIPILTPVDFLTNIHLI